MTSFEVRIGKEYDIATPRALRQLACAAALGRLLGTLALWLSRCRFPGAKLEFSRQLSRDIRGLSGPTQPEMAPRVVSDLAHAGSACRRTQLALRISTAMAPEAGAPAEGFRGFLAKLRPGDIAHDLQVPPSMLHPASSLEMYNALIGAFDERGVAWRYPRRTIVAFCRTAASRSFTAAAASPLFDDNLSFRDSHLMPIFASLQRRWTYSSLLNRQPLLSRGS